MDAGNHEEEDRCLGTTSPTRHPGAPSTPRRPLRYHNHRPHQQQHYYPFGQKHENENGNGNGNGLDHSRSHSQNHNQNQNHSHSHAHDRDPWPHQTTTFQHTHPQPPTTTTSTSTSTTSAAAGAPAAVFLTATAASLDDSSFESHAANNRNATHANAGTSIEPNGFIDPDDFYRINLDGLMASTLPPSRHNRDASLRSNGSGAVTRHPANPSTRPGAKSSVRSVSAPVEDKPPTGAARSNSTTTKVWNGRAGHQPSVKDLTKRFDQKATKMPAKAAEKTPPRVPAQEAQWSEAASQPAYRTRRSSKSDSSAGRSSASLPAARSKPRHQTVPDNNLSDNSQSFANRIAKPRESLGTHTQASKSLTNLSPTDSIAPDPPVPQSRGLLFGEVGLGELDAGLAGHGIDGVLSTRIHEPKTQGTLGRRQRSFSHTNVEPSSPSDWYRSLRDEPSDGSGVDTNALPSSLKHSRSRSEMGFTKPEQQQVSTPRSRRPKPTLDTSTATSASKIPISVRKHSTPSGSSSPNSTRSNSPSTVKRPFTQGRKFSTGQKSGSKMPSPLASPAVKRQNRPSAITPNGNTRLNAYIAAPPPKLSPPLRSSRPRQPVSTATTISSRVKAIERDKSPSKRDPRVNIKGNDQAARRRKITLGPIDYESRREQIKLSYTKSIRETEARAATRKAAEEKKKEEERAKALAAEAARTEALKRQQEENEQKELAREAAQIEADEITATAEPLTLQEIPDQPTADSVVDVDDPVFHLPPLQIAPTNPLRSDETSAFSDPGLEGQLSPPLGIPGSFPDVEIADDQDEAPPSAISNTTEFDAEPQTDPPVQENTVVIMHEAEKTSDIDGDARQTYRKSEYRSPFEDEPAADDSLSINIALDTSADSPTAPERPPVTDNETIPSQEIPVMYQEEEYDFVPPHSPTYETKVTILGRETDFTPPILEIQGPSFHVPTPELHDAADDDEQDHAGTTSLTLPEQSSSQLQVEQGQTNSSLGEIAEFLGGPSPQQHDSHWQDSTAPQADVTAAADVRIRNVQQDVEGPRYSLDSKRTPEARPSLTVPRTSESINRASQTSIWTDYSVNSQESSPEYGPTDQDTQRMPFTWRGELAYSEVDSRSESYRYSRNSMAVTHSRDVSPRGTHEEFEPDEPRHRLLEIDIGEEFAAGILSHKNSTDPSNVPGIPDHSPPLPPDNVFYRDMMSSAPASEYYDETRPNSYVHLDKDDQGLGLGLVDHLKRDSGYFAPSESAVPSIDQGSLAASEDPQSSSSHLASQQTLVESINVEQASDLPVKERKRLFTRLETIKELIDTETFFIRDMNIVEEIYKGTAEACPKLDDKTIKLIFRNTDKIIQFHTAFLVELKEGVSSIYTPRTIRQTQKDNSSSSDGAPSLSGMSTAASAQLNDDKDRETSLGPIFIRHMEDMKQVHETFLKNSDHAAKRLIQIQEDPTVQVWLNECNEVARELTRAWNLDSLLIKPMQRITKYPNLLIQLLHETPPDHPDRSSLETAKSALENAIEEINKTKKNFELVGQIVGRRRKESDVKAGFARAFGKRVDKLQPATNRPAEDAEYLKLHEKFGDDYLRLQVVLRDVEFYTRQVTDHVHEFLQYLSSMELVMRLQPSPHPEIESKWVRFNVSMRDIEKIALEQHLSQVRKQVIEPFELVIKSYSNPSLAMKKRTKRRVDYDKYIQLQKSGKKIDKQLSELVEQYEALNEALKKELPRLSMLTEKVGNICLGNFVNIQAEWYSIWKEKVKVVLEDSQVPEVSSIISTFFVDYKFQEDQINMIGIVNPASKGRPSHSTSVDEASSRFRLRPAEPSPRHRGLSLNSDIAPSLPTPDFMKRHSGQFAVSPSIVSSPAQSYRDYYNVANGHQRPPLDSPKALEFALASRSLATTPGRPGTGQSYDSTGPVRQSVESSHSQPGRYANSAHPSPYQTPENHRYSGLFQSALPLSDTPEHHVRRSQVSSRASSRERQPINGYNVLWLAASLFEFNIQTTKHEAGYPYLTYQAGEIFDVIAEKGELWLAKNQDDPNNLVGWLWSKHFAKLADD